MDQIGGPAWRDRQRDRLRSLDVDPTLDLVIEASIVDGDHGDERAEVWHLIVAAGQVTLHDGVHDEPDVRLTADVATIAAIVDGRAAAARAFLDGRLRVEGDLTALLIDGGTPRDRPVI